MTIYRPTWAQISASAFSSNVRLIKSLVGSAVQLLAVLKADAYGHGAAPLARLALQHGASAIGVSSLEEALSLRDAGVLAPVLILGGIYPLENFSIALRSNLIPTVASLEAAHALQVSAREQNKQASFHLKVDTGMGRIGVSVEGAKKILSWLVGQKEIQLAGIYSHLACADSDPDFTQHQLEQFNQLKDAALSLGFKNIIFHIANSAATFRAPQAHYDMVRPGLALYGVSENAPSSSATKLFPVLSWQTKIIFLKKVPMGTSISYDRTFVTKKESEIATLPVGYADGVHRNVSNKAFVLIKGRSCPVVGRVTMDHMMVDVTGLSVGIGEKVTLIGQDGDQELSSRDWAAWAGTVPYEIFCGVSKRVPRVLES